MCAAHSRAQSRAAALLCMMCARLDTASDLRRNKFPYGVTNTHFAVVYAGALTSKAAVASNICSLPSALEPVVESENVCKQIRFG